MLLHVTHETTYDYAPPVRTAQHMAHLKPTTTASQRLVSHRIEIDPEPAQQGETVDVYGNTRYFFSLQAAHDELRVVAHSLVETAKMAEPASSVSWEEARERMRYHRAAHYDPASEFVFASPYVPRHENFVEYAQPSFTPGRPLLEAARELM